MKVSIILSFLLLLFLIMIVYYVGTTSVIAATSGATKRVVFWLTGRDENGNTISASGG